MTSADDSPSRSCCRKDRRTASGNDAAPVSLWPWILVIVLIVFGFLLLTPASSDALLVYGNPLKEGDTHNPTISNIDLSDVPRGTSRRKLPVLIIQMDDRPLSSDLESADYISISAVVNYKYALRHGYDYRFSKVINDEIDKANVTLSPDAMINEFTTMAAQSKVALAACFHPILGVQRSTPWCKVLVSWLAAHETAYDYVIFLDSDAYVFESASCSITCVMLLRLRAV